MPDPSELTPLQRRAQLVVREMVDRVGGRFDDSRAVPVEHLDLFGELFEEWATAHGERAGDHVRFAGRPGLWHALDTLYPLQDPNRWDALRHGILRSLEAKNWRRQAPPRGSGFDITPAS